MVDARGRSADDWPDDFVRGVWSADEGAERERPPDSHVCDPDGYLQRGQLELRGTGGAAYAPVCAQPPVRRELYVVACAGLWREQHGRNQRQRAVRSEQPASGLSELELQRAEPSGDEADLRDSSELQWNLADP